MPKRVEINFGPGFRRGDPYHQAAMNVISREYDTCHLRRNCGTDNRFGCDFYIEGFGDRPWEMAEIFAERVNRQSGIIAKVVHY